MRRDFDEGPTTNMHGVSSVFDMNRSGEELRFLVNKLQVKDWIILIEQEDS